MHKLSEHAIQNLETLILSLEAKKKMWEDERDKGILQSKKVAKKYYYNVMERVKFARKQIENYNNQIKKWRVEIEQSKIFEE